MTTGASSLPSWQDVLLGPEAHASISPNAIALEEILLAEERMDRLTRTRPPRPAARAHDIAGHVADKTPAAKQAVAKPSVSTAPTAPAEQPDRIGVFETAVRALHGVTAARVRRIGGRPHTVHVVATMERCEEELVSEVRAMAAEVMHLRLADERIWVVRLLDEPVSA